MPINLKPEAEQLVQEIQSGHFHSVDELIVEGVQAWHEKNRPQAANAERRRQAVERALAFATDRAISLGGVSIRN